MFRRPRALLSCAGLSLLAATALSAAATESPEQAWPTATPIKHLVIIFGENESFDHYFGTYPHALNPRDEPAFVAGADTPPINGLDTALLEHNPNASAAANGLNKSNPFRLDRSQANTEDQTHSYTPEQLAYDHGAADLFPRYTGNNTVSSTAAFGTRGLVMGYFDGNTVTALWNYAQHFAMSDNAYTDTYGPSTPGALEVVAGTSNGAVPRVGHAEVIADTQGGYTLIGDTDPAGDVCSSAASQVSMRSRNIGNLLNDRHVSWGGFTGGFDLGRINADGSTGCTRTSYSEVLGASKTDYVPHHNWFQYYASTANPGHARPSSIAQIGHDDDKDQGPTPVHHQYDVEDFFTAVKAGNYPAVSYLKAPAIQDAHPGNSDPLDEQHFITRVLNFLQQQPEWDSTAVIITYNDSDGWYDHAFTTPTTSSFDASTPEGRVIGADQLNGPGRCDGPTAAQGVGINGGRVNGRCGPGTRIPLLVISPWAKAGHVDHVRLTQSSVIRFIEDNWLSGQRLGEGSNDAAAGSLMGLFDFSTDGHRLPALFIDPDQGTIRSQAPAS